MTHSRLPALGLLLVVLLCFQTARAQQTDSTTAANKAADAAVREKAFRLLDSLADQLGTLQSAENRARMGSNIAESIWSHDEKRARSLFAAVEDDIKPYLKDPKDDPKAEQAFPIFLKLREDTAERLTKHDPEAAFQFLKRTEPVFDGDPPPEFVERERALQLRLAKRVAADSADVSVKFARESVARKLSTDVVTLLIRLSGKDKQQTLILYKDVVDKVRDTDLARNPMDFDAARNLLEFFQPPAADGSTYRELVNIFITKGFERGCSKPPRAEYDNESGFCIQMGTLWPLLERFAPGRARSFGQWVPEQREYRFRPLDQSYYELNDLTEYGTIDEILALATKYPDLAGQIHLRAMSRAEAAGDLELAKKIASNYSGDSYAKTAMENRAKAYELSNLTDERMAQLQQSLATITPTYQVRVLLMVAKEVARLDKKTTFKLLDQANGIIDSLPPGKEQVELQMTMAIDYCIAKSDRGFGIMESLMPRLNEFIAAGAKLDGFDTRYLRDGEWNMTGEGGVGSLLTGLARNAGYFAWCDFDRAVSLASQFERSEIRIMAQLKLAQAILAGPPRNIIGAPLRF